ncbi:DUF1236 domain-containing protein [Bradyrhizobium guangzhouense]|uniref:DUF1236 domain-containing protein n=1 Tax=Bradyrhizobium guangzhouense TaxID=1325095 RepID=UPI0010099448|nr:DUF1236 domain-containing protein [Bradyrhizobium guangzhouense]RXH10598.1 DUF1236 domain-containing protein [Bradyrhizobium guangzhouense]
MRRNLLVSTAAIGLMLSSGLAYAQSSSDRKEEPRRAEEPAKGAVQRGQESTQEREPSAQSRGERAQGREEQGRPDTAEHNLPKGSEQARDSRESREPKRDAERAKQGREDSKSSAETRENSPTQKSTAETEKSKSGAAGQQKERAGAANQSERNQPTRNSAEKQPSEQQSRPSTATDTNRPASTGNAQNTSPAGGAQTNQATRENGVQGDRQARTTPEKQVRLSETFSRERLAAPERDLNISIRVGEAVPERVRLNRLPPEVVSIEPEYRDYEYFTTDDDIVIVEPGTHRIVSQVPRDPSRARAEMNGGSQSSGASTTVAGGNVNCKIMRRDASGNVVEVEPSTVGSSARSDSLSVTVQLPGGGSSGPIALGAPSGDVVVATQGQSDCTVTLEPQTR